jgi:hypothetical protein
VVFHFSQIGLVIENQKSKTSKIRTIEGSTNGEEERDSESGDGVWVKDRASNVTKCYVRVFPS